MLSYLQGQEVKASFDSPGLILLSLCMFPSTGGASGRNPPVNAGGRRDLDSVPGLGRSLEKETATHSSTLARGIPWTEEPGGLQSIVSLRVGHDWSDFTFTFHSHALEKEMATHSSVLAWRIPGTGKPGGLLSMGSHRVGYDWSDLAAAATILH